MINLKLSVESTFKKSLSICRYSRSMSSRSQPLKVIQVNGVERFENIYKAKHDERLYRGLKLNNELRALLISDPTTDKSAASLAVSVGGYANIFIHIGMRYDLNIEKRMSTRAFRCEKRLNRLKLEDIERNNI